MVSDKKVVMPLVAGLPQSQEKQKKIIKVRKK